VETAVKGFKNADKLVLQFGHGGEAVETTPVDLVPQYTGPLQFGHGGEAVETWCIAIGQLEKNHFNSATAVKPWRQRQQLLWRLRDDTLQFGHGGEAVETRRSTPSPPSWSKLQFGHGGEAVETSMNPR